MLCSRTPVTCRDPVVSIPLETERLSMYLKTPDGLRLEFTVDAPDAEQIAAMRRQDAHSELARWLAGDRRVNNDDRPH